MIEVNDPSPRLPERFFRFATVGGAFAAAYALISAILVGPIGLPAYATSVVLYALCIPAAYFTQMRVTFGMRRTRAAGFPIYAATQLACLAMVTALTTRFVTGSLWIDALIFFGSAGAAAILSYVISSRFAFRPAG
ncbi:MAG: GtrA family protein [Pseudomonadota bacterium]